MRPRREVLLTTFADPSTFPSVFETPADNSPAEETAVETAETLAAEAVHATESAKAVPATGRICGRSAAFFLHLLPRRATCFDCAPVERFR